MLLIHSMSSDSFHQAFPALFTRTLSGISSWSMVRWESWPFLQYPFDHDNSGEFCSICTYTKADGEAFLFSDRMRHSYFFDPTSFQRLLLRINQTNARLIKVNNPIERDTSCVNRLDDLVVKPLFIFLRKDDFKQMLKIKANQPVFTYDILWSEYRLASSVCNGSSAPSKSLLETINPTAGVRKPSNSKFLSNSFSFSFQILVVDCFAVSSFIFYPCIKFLP